MERTLYISGETVRIEVADSGYSAVTLRYGSASAQMALSSGVWTAAIDTTRLSGRVNWAAFASGEAVASGSFTVRVLVSQYRAVVEAIDAAMRKVGANGKYSVTVGEISLTDKTFDEMQRFRAYYAALADGEESGDAPRLGPWRTTGVYS